MLHNFPEWGIHLAIVVPITVTITLIPYLGQKLFSISANDDRSRGALEAFKAIVASLAFLLAFTLAQAQATLRTSETLAAQEAAALNTIDRSLLRYNTDEFLVLRTALHQLVRLLISEEWPALAQAQRSDRAEAIVDLLSKSLRTAEAASPRQQALLTELIAKLDEFTDKREELIQVAATDLPGFFWDTIASIMLVLALLAVFITPNRERILSISGIAAAAALVLALVVIEDAPFAGGAQITPEPLQKVLGLMEARQKDPIPPVLPARKP